MSSPTKIYKVPPGDRMVVKAGGEIALEGGTLTVEGNTAIADAVAITGGEAPTEAEFNSLQTKLNAVLAALRTAGIVPTS